MRGISQLPEKWLARLVALPGMLTVLSVLAVLLGTHPPPYGPPPRVVASPVSPAPAELAPLPQNGAGPGVAWLAAPPPAPFVPAGAVPGRVRAALSITAPFLPLELSVLGRRQMDGG